MLQPGVDACGVRAYAMPADSAKTSRLSRLRYLATIAAIARLYFATAKFGFLLAFATRQVTAVWPPTGLAFAAYVLFGYRAWPGVCLGAFLANALRNEPLPTAPGMAAGNTLAGIIGLFLLRRLGGLDHCLGKAEGRPEFGPHQPPVPSPESLQKA